MTIEEQKLQAKLRLQKMLRCLIFFIAFSSSTTFAFHAVNPPTQIDTGHSQSRFAPHPEGSWVVSNHDRGLTHEQFLALAPEQQENYIRGIRLTYYDLEKLYAKMINDAKSSQGAAISPSLLKKLYALGIAQVEMASAAPSIMDQSMPCPIAGWVVQKTPTNSQAFLCPDPPASDKGSCGPGQVRCNPLWFGTKSDGLPVCAQRSEGYWTTDLRTSDRCEINSGGNVTTQSAEYARTHPQEFTEQSAAIDAICNSPEQRFRSTKHRDEKFCPTIRRRREQTIMINQDYMRRHPNESAGASPAVTPASTTPLSASAQPGNAEAGGRPAPAAAPVGVRTSPTSTPVGGAAPQGRHRRTRRTAASAGGARSGRAAAGAHAAPGAASAASEGSEFDERTPKGGECLGYQLLSDLDPTSMHSAEPDLLMKLKDAQGLMCTNKPISEESVRFIQQKIAAKRAQIPSLSADLRRHQTKLLEDLEINFNNCLAAARDDRAHGQTVRTATVPIEIEGSLFRLPMTTYMTGANRDIATVPYTHIGDLSAMLGLLYREAGKPLLCDLLWSEYPGIKGRPGEAPPTIYRTINPPQPLSVVVPGQPIQLLPAPPPSVPETPYDFGSPQYQPPSHTRGRH